METNIQLIDAVSHHRSQHNQPPTPRMSQCWEPEDSQPVTITTAQLFEKLKLPNHSSSPHQKQPEGVAGSTVHAWQNKQHFFFRFSRRSTHTRGSNVEISLSKCLFVLKPRQNIGFFEKELHNFESVHRCLRTAYPFRSWGWSLISKSNTTMLEGRIVSATPDACCDDEAYLWGGGEEGMAGARYCQVVISASRKLKHEDLHVRKGLVLNRDDLFWPVKSLQQRITHTVETARAHVEFKLMWMRRVLPNYKITLLSESNPLKERGSRNCGSSSCCPVPSVKSE